MNPTDTRTEPLLASGGKLLIGPDWRDAASGQRFQALNPATGDTIAEIAQGGAADVDSAVQAAQAAYRGPWSKMSASERGRWSATSASPRSGNDDSARVTAGRGSPPSRA